MRGEAYITGIGQSEVAIRTSRSPMLLTLDAVREALDDAGLSLGQIDGVMTFPGKLASNPGFSLIGADELIDALGIAISWHLGGMEQPAQLSAVALAAAAVKAGMCRHVICFRTVYEAAAPTRPDEYPRLAAKSVDGPMQWLLPFNAMSAACWTAQYAMRHMVRYGMTREQLGQIAINASRNAIRNPRAAAFNKAELTLDRYMEARMISSPMCLYDCDRFSDGSTVLIVSTGDALDEVSSRPVRIAAMSGSMGRVTYDQAEWTAPYDAGPALWANCDYAPADVDTVQLYDGFSFFVINWLEGLGFCERGEGHRFVEGGSRIAFDGELPLNTHGGQLGAGRLHGFGFAHEAVTQLRGTAGDRQLASGPRLAVAASGGGNMAAALLLAID
jgi:acetyl-CoA acetyltransferase